MAAPRRAARAAGRYAIVRARFNAPITQALLDGALRAFGDAGVAKTRLTVVEVPGAFELPLAAAWLARSKRFLGIVALGCVIRGETPHFDFVAGEAARGIARVALDFGIPVAFGVLTCDTVEQAEARSAAVADGADDHLGEPGASNKGYEAARTALEMAAIRRRL